MMLDQYDYISILGPTASGKTAIALELAKLYPIEIISVDSVSVYKGLDIGSAKPSYEEMQSVPHHLIDVCTLSEVFTVGKFVEEAKELIHEIKSRDKTPVFCGGTLMYMKALMQDYHSLPTLSLAITNDLNQILATQGKEVLYDLLLKEDPKIAKRLHQNDAQRVMRALGVKRETGRSLLEYWQQESSCKFKGYDFLIGVNNREMHRQAIANRVDQMFAYGFLQECKDVLHAHGPEIMTHPAIKSIGYKEMMMYICKILDEISVREKVVVSTAQFVKRQMTWLNNWSNEDSMLLKLYNDKKEKINLVDSIVEYIER